ncbi:hypothetical protein [Clostridium mediterraneense]|uniref:hypothetical protein n=1 Tax=Clostridium mediterraneense TaxID=1805472 RepID=UPI00083735FB|nr:hypothetical protein [Clostridium mediterraneense]
MNRYTACKEITKEWAEVVTYNNYYNKDTFLQRYYEHIAIIDRMDEQFCYLLKFNLDTEEKGYISNRDITLVIIYLCEIRYKKI